jgi:hypothetical protein
METAQDPVERPVLAPAAEPVVDALPTPVTLGQLPPLGSGVEDPKDAVEGRAVIVPLAPPLAVGREQILDQGVSSVGQFVAACHGGLRTPGAAIVTLSDSPDRT